MGCTRWSEPQAENFIIYLNKHKHRIVNYGYLQAEGSNSKFEKSGGISGGQRVKWLKHKIKKVLPAIKDKIGRACLIKAEHLSGKLFSHFEHD